MTSVLCLRGWERFQHYKDRDPPWVKLYRDLLTTESWVLGTDVSRLVQVASVLLAARYSNQIPMQWSLIKKVASLDCSEKQFLEAVRHLTSTNFLEIQECTEKVNGVAHDASNTLATCATEILPSSPPHTPPLTPLREAEAEAEAKGASAPVAGLDLKAWGEWFAYKQGSKHKLKAVSIPHAQRELAGFGAAQARVVSHSIANGWQGLFAPKNVPKSKAVQMNPDGTVAMFAGKPVEW